MRHRILALAALLAGHAALLGAPPEALTAGAPPRTLVGALAHLELGAALPARDPLEVTGGYFAYCEKINDCPASRVLRIGKTPLMFQAYTKATEALRDKAVDITWELSTEDGEVFFEATHEFRLRHIPEQISGLIFRKLPKELRSLEPGRYQYRVTVLSADGAHEASWSRRVVARK